MGKGKYGIKLKIPEIYECRETREIQVKVNERIIKGRPKVVLKQLIELFYEKEYFNADLIEDLIIFGFDRGYWTDTSIFSASFKYFMFDMYKTKEKRLKELDSD